MEVPKWFLALWFVFLTVTIISVTFIFSIYFLPYTENLIVGCEGIERFYSGDGFYDDLSDMRKAFKNNGYVNMTTLVPTFYHVQPPSSIIEGNDYDCKTISNSIYCLSQKYNMYCKFVRTMSFITFQSYPGHRGIICWNDEFNKWEELY